MPRYRMHLLNDDGLLLGGLDFVRSSDYDALAAARARLKPETRVEVWDGPRIVGVLDQAGYRHVGSDGRTRASTTALTGTVARRMTGLHAFSTLGCPDLSLDEVIDLAARHGLSAVELRALDGRLDLPDALAAKYVTPARLADRLATSPVEVVSLGTSVRLMTPALDDRANLIAHVVWAEAIGARSLRVFDGGERATANEIEQARNLLHWWREMRAEYRWSVDLVVETHDALAQPLALRRFVEEIPEALILWDAHHTWKKGGERPALTWETVAGHTTHIHVKDSVSEPGAKLPYRYVAPGTGEFPMRELLAALTADGYAGVLSLEWERLWHPELPPLDTALDSASDSQWW